jgi:DNA-binding transcriptional MerR regulator
VDVFDLKALSALTGVSARTVHFYVQQGLLPPPEGAGRASRYTAVHLDRLRLIRRLQEQHLPLAEIRRQVETLTDVELRRLSAEVPQPRAKSAADYIRQVLAKGVERNSRPTASRPSPPDTSPPPALKGSEPERSQWERLVLAPDIELHIRRPLSRVMNRKLDKLIEHARILLREDS